MNCQELIGILDDQRIDRLDAARRQQAEAHVAACEDCARAWSVQSSLAALPDMAVPAGFLAHCRAAATTRTVPATGRSTHSRKLAWGSLAVLAAAAAMLVVSLRPAAPTTPQQTARVAAVDAVPPAVDVVPAVRPVELPPAIVPAVAIKPPAPLFTVRVMLAEPLDGGPRMDAASTLPEAAQKVLRAFAEDPPMEQALQSLQVAVLEELRRIPGLALVDSDPAEVAPSSRNFRLQIGTLLAPGSDGRLRRSDSRYVSANITAEQLQPGGKSINRFTAQSTIDLQAACSNAGPVVDPACSDVRGAAAEMVRELRLQVFPPDSSVVRTLQARFQDSSLDVAQRLKVLAELLKQQTNTGGNSPLRDPGVVRAAIELAANVEPALRMQIWRSMRGVGNAALVEPLARSLALDPDEVRLAAIETLAADFGGDPRVRSALQTAALGDPRPLVRAVAERGLSGEEEWRRYVVASLKDSSRLAAQRIEALQYYLYPPGPEPGSFSTNPDYWQIMRDLLDDAAVRALAAALPAAGPLQGARGQLLISNFAYHYSQNPAVTEMLLGYLEHDPWVRNRNIAGEVLARTHGNDPRIRAALEKALDSDPDPGVWDSIRLIMEEKDR